MKSKVVYVANVTPLPGLESSMVFASCLGDPVQVGDALVRLACENYAPRLRQFPAGDFFLFYRSLDKGIELIRVIHGARDIPRQFKK